MKALVTGITGLRNRGVEALAVSSIAALLDAGFTRIRVASSDVGFDTPRLAGPQVELLDDCAGIFRGGTLRTMRASLSNVVPKLSPRYQKLVAAIKDSNLVIASGGDIFSADYGTPFLLRQLRVLELAGKLGVPYMFLAQSIGPFKTDEQISAWKRVGAAAALVSVRERLTYDYLTKKLGMSTSNIVLTADPAFLLKPVTGQTLTNMRGSFGLRSDLPTIAVAPSQGISGFSNVDGQKHFEAWVSHLRFLVSRLGAQVLVVPHVQDSKPTNNDLLLTTRLMRAIDFDPRVHLVGGELTASDYKGLIGSCDMVVAERMHAAIAGLSSGICTVAISYSIKADGIMGDIVGSDSAQNGTLMPLAEFMKPEVAQPLIERAWNDRKALAELIRQKLPGVQAASRRNFELAAKLAQGAPAVAGVA